MTDSKTFMSVAMSDSLKSWHENNQIAKGQEAIDICFVDEEKKLKL